MPIDARTSELVLTNTVARINIRVVDEAGVPVDADTVTLSIRDLYDTEVYTQSGVRVVNPGTGLYYFPLGDLVVNTETSTPRRLMAIWAVTRDTIDSELETIVQDIRIVSARTLALANDLRLIIDKAAMAVSDDPNAPNFLGYTDAMLVNFMEGGLGILNAYQPYPVWRSVDEFPIEYHARILLDAAFLVGLDSQEMFAIVTDLPNYSDNGQSFVLQHQPQLSAMAQRITQRLDRLVPDMKKRYLGASGGIYLQQGPNYRLAHMLAAAPSGSLFYSMYSAG